MDKVKLFEDRGRGYVCGVLAGLGISGVSGTSGQYDTWDLEYYSGGSFVRAEVKCRGKAYDDYMMDEDKHKRLVKLDSLGEGIEYVFISVVPIKGKCYFWNLADGYDAGEWGARANQLEEGARVVIRERWLYPVNKCFLVCDL